MENSARVVEWIEAIARNLALLAGVFILIQSANSEYAAPDRIFLGVVGLTFIVVAVVWQVRNVRRSGKPRQALNPGEEPGWVQQALMSLLLVFLLSVGMSCWSAALSKLTELSH